MKMKKLLITDDKFNINLKLYFFLKYLIKAQLTDNQSFKILEICTLNPTNFRDKLQQYALEEIKDKSKKQGFILEIIDKVNEEVDSELFAFSLRLFMMKDLLLAEAKTKHMINISTLGTLDPLSLEYDNLTLYKPYSTRVQGALLVLESFNALEQNAVNFMSKDAEDFIKDLSALVNTLKTKNVESNQIFMLIFNESMNQSITSDSGLNYEDRITQVLSKIGISDKDITKEHDKIDSSTEYDFFFTLNSKTYGISAKRTLRERYKQFIKTAHMDKLDVMIEITLGTDLTKEKVNAIRGHDVFLFVANEIYDKHNYMQGALGVYPSRELTKETLEAMISP
ncbi:type II restriction endonuclease [Bathymodiolus thermophilus thioautotrophic gill symbiont]|uniref:Uncharacterized protein n=1 Tax=Bathymodiolus thermophilus thioautotrophic gill symbiont TaxID=2360 RepID=A0A1J5U614_9GAMM|nr:type II restriction endonuclease [Bathymodiolus thermophilus thioautotrophic gill symbiont]OIR23841.1 hypothetical protein BGC33_08380 [Bathymodiolus thermophilus thioautotrophic gill symbiont]